MAYLFTSASQITSYRACQRKWHNNSILKIREPKKPAQARGTGCHGITEGYLRTGKMSPPEVVPADVTDAAEWLPIVQAGAAALPAPGPKLLVEQKIEFPTPHGPTLIGYIDFIDRETTPIRVGDHKTISDFRYCKTPEELLNDTQMMTYARWALKTFSVDTVLVEHLYLRTKKPYKGHRVSAIATVDQAEAIWTRDMVTVGEMKGWAEAGLKTSDDLPPTTSHCSAYGGCHYRELCGLSPISKLNLWPIKKSEKEEASVSETTSGTNGKVMTLAEKIAAKRAAAGAEAAASGVVAATPAEGTPMLTGEAAKARAKELGVDIPAGAGFAGTAGAEGVVPPDAPPRETPQPAFVPVVVAAVEEPPKAKRGRPKKAAEAVAETPSEQMVAPVEAEVEVETPAQAKRGKVSPHMIKPLEIWLDCVATKYRDLDVVPTLFEDFIAPIAEKVAADNGIKDPRLMDYGKGKIAVALAVAARLDDLPEILVVNSMSPYAHEVVDILIPVASRVFRALKG